MVKIISLIIFVSALVLSWCAFNSRSEMGIDVHAGIQSKLSILIEDTIKAKRPQSDNFKLLKMYTQKLDDKKVMAHFSYEFQDQLSVNENAANEKTTQKITGTAILVKTLSEDPSVQKWALQSVNTGTETVDFKEGLIITSEGQPAKDLDAPKDVESKSEKEPSENK